VLLVDDDENAASLLGEVIGSDGFLVDLAFNGLEAIQKVSTKKYSAIVLDFVLPDMRGDEVCEQIKSIDPDVVVILLTGMRFSPNEPKISRFDQVLNKPAHPLTVLNALRKSVKEALVYPDMRRPH
jgi:CheY-like chemotaxis protein